MGARRQQQAARTVRKRRASASRVRVAPAPQKRASAAPRAERMPKGDRGRTSSSRSAPARLRWVAQVNSEGGPLLLADLEDFLRWRGESEESQTRLVKYYGRIVDRLPPWLTPRGASSWHQFLEVPTAKDADRWIAQLRAAISSLEPNVVERVQKALTESDILAKAREAMETKGAGMKAWLAAWRQSIEQGIDFLVGAERVLHVQVDPASDYDRAREPLSERTSGGACLATWSGNARGLLWDLQGEGSAEVGVDRAAREVILLRAWADGASEKAALRRKAATPDPANAGVGEIVLSSGVLVAIWAPMWVGSLEGVKGEPEAWFKSAASRATPQRLHADGFEDVGTVLTVAPGRYVVERGAHDAGTFAGRWCRLVYAGPIT